MEWMLLLKAVGALMLTLGLIGLVAWLFNRFGPSIPGMTVTKPQGRAEKRLSIVEIHPIDMRHKLYLIRRDGVEHLLLIGPAPASPIVIESGIVKTGISPISLSSVETATA
jgi:flagellar protein FliO/FliZ